MLYWVVQSKIKNMYMYILNAVLGGAKQNKKKYVNAESMEIPEEFLWLEIERYTTKERERVWDSKETELVFFLH